MPSSRAAISDSPRGISCRIRFRTRFDSLISRRHWHKFYVDIRKERMVYLFTTRAGRLLDQRNTLKALHGAGNRGGFHAFRRFRFAVLRKAGVPENLIKQWMGHSQNLMDLYAAQITARHGLSSRMVR